MKFTLLREARPRFRGCRFRVPGFELHSRPETRSSKIFSHLLCMVAGVILSACATTQHLDVVEREQRRLRAENAEVRTENAALRSESESVRSALADTRANLNEVQRELNAVKGKMEEMRYLMDRQAGQSAREGDQRIKEMESRMAMLDEELKVQGKLLKAREEELRTLHEALQRGGRESAPLGPGKGPGDLAREKGSAPGEAEGVRKDYEEALRLLDRKDFRAAIGLFKEFLKRHPKSDLADNAQYWIGESHYALKEFDQAILEFDSVRRKYPDGDKVPAALLKQGFAFAELGDKVDARLILQELVNRYPKSEEAAKAKQKLKALES
ncbi:MAG: tol-pal system protein YbgF [Candidatus Binatia bacterium]